MRSVLTGFVLFGLVIGILITTFVESVAWLFDRLLSAIGMS